MTLPEGRRRSRGLTLFELLVALSMVAVILGATQLILMSSRQTWARLSGDQAGAFQLQKAESWLRRDLSLTAYETVRVQPGPQSLAGRDGDAVWFLSAIDPATGEFVRHPDGSPRWQRNILYYSVIPKGPADFQGSGHQVDGYESSYPYKLLVRKEIDVAPATAASNPTAQETQISDIAPYLERPDGVVFPSQDAEVTLVASHLLRFSVVPDDALRGLRIVLQAAALEEARREFAIGSRPLREPRFLLERRSWMFPENRPGSSFGPS